MISAETLFVSPSRHHMGYLVRFHTGPQNEELSYYGKDREHLERKVKKSWRQKSQF
tara:strand:+ start:167 stop:334 length:168 start_codon:yes stop_codon:yes gene_type:complete